MARKDEHRATDRPGIKQRIKDGKYLVVIDLGRQLKLDKKPEKSFSSNVKRRGSSTH